MSGQSLDVRLTAQQLVPCLDTDEALLNVTGSGPGNAMEGRGGRKGQRGGGASSLSDPLRQRGSTHGRHPPPGFRPKGEV